MKTPNLKRFAADDAKRREQIETHRQAMKALGCVRTEAARELRKTMSVVEIAREMGVTRQEIYRVLRGAGG